ncbi:hypothetical protein TrRE_jg9318 [Triparma retinervis]|uniref:Uncharacterized protein n=1 Tax=Triparma retinervis TaxID=2557542 RepID=A0A9W7DMB4_9STRA|nr:hypothetical protein TrRE_jg9318 [Triparma retinervis]
MSQEPLAPNEVVEEGEVEMAMGLAYSDLNKDHLEAIFSTEDMDERIRLTAESLNVKHYSNNPRSAIMVDFCYFNIMFAKENEFTDQQTSAFYSIMLKVFVSAVDNGFSSTEAFDLFKKLILTHSIEDGEAVELYPLPLVKKISNYVSNTFFRYLDAYKYVFTTTQSVVTETAELQVETPLIPQLLAEAATEENVEVFDDGEKDGAGTGVGEGGGGGEEVAEVFELSV